MLITSSTFDKYLSLFLLASIQKNSFLLSNGNNTKYLERIFPNEFYKMDLEVWNKAALYA